MREKKKREYEPLRQIAKAPPQNRRRSFKRKLASAEIEETETVRLLNHGTKPRMKVT